MSKEQFYTIIKRVAPWLAFSALLVWGWRIGDIFRQIPSYGDALEAIWGIQWYYETIFVQHTSPLFTSTAIFHPYGWHTATLAFTPTLFLLAQPFHIMGGAAFAYNSLSLISLFVAFAGCLRFARLYAPVFPATVAALVCTFTSMRWLRIPGGQINILWISSLTPWLLWGLEKMRRSDAVRPDKKLIALCGLVWGGMINFSLYGIFLGGIAFAVWGTQLFRWRRLLQAALMAAIALAVAMPVTILYAVGSRADGTHAFSILELQNFAVSLNCLFAPFGNHPLAPVQNLARAIYTGPGPYLEWGWVNLGLTSFALCGIGLAPGAKARSNRLGLVWVALCGLILSLGLVLKWNGQEISSPLFQPLNNLLWKVGHTLKPTMFPTVTTPPPLDTGLPLPGFALSAIVPFWEGARVSARYALLGGLGLIVLAGVGLQRLPRPAQVVLAMIWLIEVLPQPLDFPPLVPVVLPTQPHPAYQWVAQQPLGKGEGIIDLSYPTIIHSGEILFATQFYHIPTASSTGSFLPPHTRFLLEYFFSNKQALSMPDTARLLNEYHVRYILFHIKQPEARQMWKMARGNSSLRAVGCFDPLPELNPWPYPICIAEVTVSPAARINVFPTSGWSDPEEWGMWAEGQASQAYWIASAPGDYRLSVEAFPHCVAGAQQQVSIEINDTPLHTHTWQQCETWHDTLVIPQSAIQRGKNQIELNYEYTTSPISATNGLNSDRRLLSVGFVELKFEAEGQ